MCSQEIQSREKAIRAAHKVFCEDWGTVTKKAFCLHLAHECGWNLMTGRKLEVEGYEAGYAKKAYEHFLKSPI